MKLSVYICAYNEEKRIEKTLQAAQQLADEIVLVDSGSTDNTINIAKKYGAKVIHHGWETYSKQKSFAEKSCTYDWVLLLDADEVLSPKLIEEILEVKKNPIHNVYNLKIVNMFTGQIKPSLFGKKFNIIRLYNRKYASMPPECGNKDRVRLLNPNEKIGQLDSYIFHYCFLSIEQAVEKYNRHSSEMQKTLLEENKHFSKLRLFTEYPRQFIKYYFFERMVFWGINGFILANILAYFRFLKIAKWFEIKNQQQL